MRKLASIQTIKDITPIEGKDKIVLATLGNGWKVIVQKDSYPVNDVVVYFEIDSILPDIPKFGFVKRRSNNMRIRTMKMGDVISQGLCITIHEANEIANELGTTFPKIFSIGTDVTDVLKVSKYEEDETNRVTTNNSKYNSLEKFMMKFRFYRYIDSKFIHAKGSSSEWPNIGLEKTDEERWQNKTNEIAQWKSEGLKFHKTVKMDGQSATFILVKKPKKFYQRYPKFEFIVCSKNRRLNPKSDSDRKFFDIAKKFDIENVLKELMNYGCNLTIDNDSVNNIEWVALQGEQCGPGIQSNRIGLNETTLYIFNWKFKTSDGIVHIVNPQKYKGYLNGINPYLKLVPYLGCEELPDDFDKDSVGYYDEQRKLLREGVVYRNYDKGISFKAVSPDYLAKNNC